MSQARVSVASTGKSGAARFSEAEWKTRLDLAACYRLVHRFGMTDLIYNHITAKIPGTDHQYLINPYGHYYSEITASSLIRIDLDGNILDDTPYEINPAGYVIHSAIHGGRPDIQCVIHTHSRAGTVVSALEEGLIPIAQGGFQFYNRVAYHNYEGFAVDENERKSLVADLGRRSVMILRNHGVLTCGRSVSEAFRLMYYLEQACRLQIEMMATGGRLRLPPAEVMEHTAQQWEGGAANIGTVESREWPALLRLLDKDDPSWRT
ncbi:MAG: class II aldolase/adducin family protein [Reyranellaceae bacterium]